MNGSPAVRRARDVQTRGKPIDAVIAASANRQHGVVSRRQLLESGVGREAIQHRLEMGRLHRVHRGVYAVGHSILTQDGTRMAAVLASGPGAVLSHRAAMAHWGLRASGWLEVTVARSHRQLPGIRIHLLPLPEDEVTTERGVPVTTVPRTLFDLATVLPRYQLERVMHEAEVQRLNHTLSVPDLVRRHPRRKGAATIRAILAKGIRVTRSELESQFLAFVNKVRLPAPEVNVALFVAGRWLECDCLWRSARVIVELDGRATHDTPRAFESDRVRDRILMARGWRVVRVTWRQLHHEPEALAYDLRTLLTSDSGTAPSRSTFQLRSDS